MTLRKVFVQRWDYVQELQKYDAVPAGEALFHCWGCDYEEFETGPGNFTVAIVEWPDGKIEIVQPRFIQFLPQETS